MLGRLLSWVSGGGGSVSDESSSNQNSSLHQTLVDGDKPEDTVLVGDLRDSDSQATSASKELPLATSNNSQAAPVSSSSSASSLDLPPPTVVAAVIPTHDASSDAPVADLQEQTPQSTHATLRHRLPSSKNTTSRGSGASDVTYAYPKPTMESGHYLEFPVQESKQSKAETGVGTKRVTR